MTTPLARSSAYLGALLFTLVLIGTVTADRLRAQDRPPSASLLRVLAEIADEYHTGDSVYLVAMYRYPHTVLGSFSSLREARSVQEDSGSTYGVFGPYLTPRDAVADTSIRVTGVAITFQTPDGPRTRQVHEDVDALFLTASSIDKFLIPYYSRIYGPEYARKLRSLMIPRVPRVGGCHRKSTPCDESVDGNHLILVR